ncbi:hypothetical protein Pint_15377 [Pistacia integerrima]|uniref:Uncharacterized protein n=1 Tax=Pistacia integerrima TaxID=434235 RepID=A0ACC0ZBC6_9ROSI|nr:hypothetical protein Pint_15377 [Pistacia integerrima]
MTTTCVSFSSMLSLYAFYEVPPEASACYLRVAPWISSVLSRPPQNQPPPLLPHKTPHLQPPQQQKQQPHLKPNMHCRPSSPISYSPNTQMSSIVTNFLFSYEGVALGIGVTLAYSNALRNLRPLCQFEVSNPAANVSDTQATSPSLTL